LFSAARGLDIPDVDWVIQYSPPQDPKQFTHRCGRTARVGRAGKALVFLLPNEDTFIEFLRIRKIPLDEYSITQTWTKEVVIKAVRNLCCRDRDVMEKGVTAFVSWVRSYMEHQAGYIFNIKDVDVSGVAEGFGLLKMPRMPELKGVEGFEGVDIDFDAIP
jgi:ATP-dependent RNA helicase DDX55/SPB4